MPSQKKGAMVRQVVGYDRFVGEHASEAVHQTLLGATPVYQLLPALDGLQTSPRGIWEKCSRGLTKCFSAHHIGSRNASIEL